MHLTNECARATLMADRCESYRQATIEKQTQEETQKFHAAEKRKASHLARDLRVQPAATVEKLGAFGEGARSMGLIVEDLIDIVRTEGYLPRESLELGICLQGVAPTREGITQDVTAYGIHLFNLGCTPGVAPAVIEEWLRPENRPDVLQGVPGSEIVGGDADENRDLLLEELEAARDRLYAEAERLSRDVDLPRLVARLERASILTEEAAKRVARSHSEARSTYHRASNALWPLLDREQAEDLPLVGEEDDTVEGQDAAGVGVASEVAQPASAGGFGRLRYRSLGRSPRVPKTNLRIRAEDSAQIVTAEVVSIDREPSGQEPQDGVFRPAGGRVSAPCGTRGGEWIDVAGDRPDEEVRPVPDWTKMVPVSACRRADSLLNEEAEKGASSDPVIDGLTGLGSSRTSSHYRAVGIARPASDVGVPRGVNGSQNEPETGAGASSQVIETTENSGEARLPGSGREKGDPGGGADLLKPFARLAGVDPCQAPLSG